MNALSIYKIQQCFKTNLSKLLIEISKSFLKILFALSLIALTVRAVSFLDLIVEMAIN